jgi:phospholipid/cholesterol/gamma-HCH transport system ATP-binding protein
MVEAADLYEVPLSDVSFTLNRGDLVMVDVGDHYLHSPLSDAAEGLVPPAQGTIRFLGEDWLSMDPTRASACRGSIRRVFRSRGWLSNLDVDENIMLPMIHHTRQPVEEIRAAAQGLAREFGLGELPRVRPPKVNRSDLKRAEWVRAFLGQPQLVILEEPSADIYAGATRPLADAVQRARARGAGVLWVTTSSELRNFGDVKPSQTLTLSGSAGVSVEKES